MSTTTKNVLSGGLPKVCCAIAGHWSCGMNGEWDFAIDKGRLGRLVSINETTTLVELQMSVRKAFGVSNMGASLSFWNTRFGCTNLGSKMPPFLIESDCGVRNFFLMLVDKSDRYLLVTFVNNEVDVGFRTPDVGIKKRRALSVGETSHAETKKYVLSKRRAGKGCIPEVPMVDDDIGLVEVVEAYEEQLMSNGKSGFMGSSKTEQEGECLLKTPVTTQKPTSVSASTFAPAGSLGSIPIRIDSEEDDILVQGVEVLEEHMQSNAKDKMRAEPDFKLLDEDDISDGADVEVSDEDVRSKGYDTEFWKPLVEDMYGGSDAMEVMCSTNSVFDHSVKLGCNVERDEYAKVDPEFRFTNMDPVFSCQAETQGSGFTSGSGVLNSGSRGQRWKDRASVSFNTSGVNSGSCGQTSDECVRQRSFSEVSDEEFDVEPLFDDTLYERAQIPDLDKDESDERIYVGKTFLNKLDCQISLAIYAIKNMFYFKQTRSNRDYIVLNCADVLCGWRVTAHEVNCYWKIRKAALQHICSIETRSQYTKLASSKVITAMYRAKFVGRDSGPKPMDLQQMLLEDLKLSTSFRICWKAREAANEENHGSEEEAYFNLIWYLHMLKLANPRTVADVETEADGVGGERFLYLFLAFGASILEFINIRPVIVIDGTHLCGKYEGVLLTASGQDANFQIYPLAFVVVDSENEKSWTWFLRKVERIIADNPRVAIVSDRANCILKAVKEVFPKARHEACVVHLARNMISNFKNKGLENMVIEVACAHKVGHFSAAFENIKSTNMEYAKYLHSSGLGTWTRVYFGGARYNLMTTNIAESLNNALRKARKSPITELVMYIQSLLTCWFAARRKKSHAHGGLVTPQVDKVMTRNPSHAKGSRVTCIEGWRYEVIGQFGERNNVELHDKQCSCKVYDHIQIPCGHAMMAGDVVGLPYSQLCSHYYTTASWRETYKDVVQPHEDPRDVVIHEDIENVVMMPPRTRRPPGRPKQKRIP